MQPLWLLAGHSMFALHKESSPGGESTREHDVSLLPRSLSGDNERY